MYRAKDYVYKNRTKTDYPTNCYEQIRVKSFLLFPLETRGISFYFTILEIKY